MKPKYERNLRLYIGSIRGVPLAEMARIENISGPRVYQIVASVEYQLAKGNRDYWEEYQRQAGSYSKI